VRSRGCPYRGRITLLRSTRYLFAYSFDRRMGWDDIVLDGVDVEMVPGDHESILAKPMVSTLAEKLDRHLTAAWAGRPRAQEARTAVAPRRPARSRHSMRRPGSGSGVPPCDAQVTPP
jgi:hypothetical protein